LSKAALNVKDELYRDEFGFEYPITNWIDFEGDECAPEDAVVAVAGCNGRWFPLLLADFANPIPQGGDDGR
jgi:hypothetical protein